MPARVGLTGGIGSGKSTVAALFNQLGIETIDADTIARQLSQRGTRQFDQIVSVFGSQILGDDGEINRKKLAEIVFSDSCQRQTLESILHPAIRKTTDNFCLGQERGYCILEIPLLIESGQYQHMDRVLVVTSKTESRTARLRQFRNMESDLARRIIETQLSDDRRITYADDIIRNDSSIDDLQNQVESLHQQYSKMFS